MGIILAAGLSGCVTAPQSCVREGEVSGLPYYLFTVPTKNSNERLPLILALHGAGGTGEQYLELWKKEAAKRRIMVVAPTMAYSYRKDRESLQGFYQLVEEISAHYPVDRDRIFLAGSSAGALIGGWVIEQDPSFWRGAILINSPGFQPREKSIQGPSFPRFLFVHGEKDKAFPVSRIREHAKSLREGGLEVTVLTDPTAGHEHKPEWNEKIFDWIEAHYSTIR